MAHRDYKLFMVRIPGGQIPDRAGKVSVHRFDFAGSVPQLLGELEAGWEPVSHTFDFVAGDVLVTMLMFRDSSIPDDARSVTQEPEPNDPPS